MDETQAQLGQMARLPDGVKLIEARMVDDRTLEFELESDADNIFKARQDLDNHQVHVYLEAAAARQGFIGATINPVRSTIFLVDEDGEVVVDNIMKPGRRFRCTYQLQKMYPAR